MDFKTLISNAIGSLAWPVTIGILFYLFRKPIADLVKLLSRLKYGELEIEFGQQIKAAEDTANENLPEHKESQEDGEVRDRILKIIPISPKAAIIEAWRYVETVSIDSANTANIELTNSAFKKPLQIANALFENDILEEESIKLFRKLRQLRNEAVHYEKMVLTNEQALSFLNSALKLATTMRDKSLSKG